MTDNRADVDERRLKENIKREINQFEQRRWLSKAKNAGDYAGPAAILYFGVYLGGLIVLTGVVGFLSYEGIIKLASITIVDLIIAAVGVLIIIGSVFVSRTTRVAISADNKGGGKSW